MAIYSFLRSFHYSFVICQSKVIIGTKVQNFLTICYNFHTLWAIYHTLNFISPCILYTFDGFLTNSIQL